MVDSQPDGDDGSTRDAPGEATEPPMREVDAYAIISYLLAGVILYGGIGWLLDWWLGHPRFRCGRHRAGGSRRSVGGVAPVQ